MDCTTKVEDFKANLKNQKSPEDLYLMDLRNSEAFKKDGKLSSLDFCNFSSNNKILPFVKGAILLLQ